MKYDVAEYQVVVALSCQELACRVNTHLKDGWQLYGPMCADQRQYMQPMVIAERQCLDLMWRQLRRSVAKHYYARNKGMCCEN